MLSQTEAADLVERFAAQETDEPGQGQKDVESLDWQWRDKVGIFAGIHKGFSPAAPAASAVPVQGDRDGGGVGEGGVASSQKAPRTTNLVSFPPAVCIFFKRFIKFDLERGLPRISCSLYFLTKITHALLYKK